MTLYSDDISIHENLLSQEELLYLNKLMDIEDPEFWIKFDQKKQYFDSISVDVSKLANFLNIITENGKYNIQELGLNMIEPSRQLDNSTHFDVCDFSYVAYINDDFKGGDFIYYVNDIEHRIKPRKGLIRVKVGNSCI